MDYNYSLFVCQPRSPEVPWVFITAVRAETQEKAMEYFRESGLIYPLDIEEEHIITFR